MNLFYVDAVIGTKYFATIQGRVRECFFLGTEGVKKRGCCLCFYLLYVAGIGFVKFPFARHNETMNSWYYGLSFDSILGESVDDLRDGKFIQAFYGTSDNPNCAGLFQRYIPELYWGDYTSPWAYAFSEETFIPYVEYEIQWTFWRIDEKGFHHDIDLSKYYLSEQDCRDANYNRFDPITF